MATIRTRKLNVSYYLVREGKYQVAYCPALELSAYGLTVTEAKRAFGEVLKIFIEETERKGTLEKVLLGLGWTLQQKPTFKYVPPKLSSKERGRVPRDSTSRLTKSVAISYSSV